MKSIISALFVLSFTFLSAQPFMKDLKGTERNFYDIQREANEYFSKAGKGRGTGYKHYKRWEYRVESKVYPSGDLSLVNTDQASQSYAKWKERYGVRRSQGGNFTEFGKTSWVPASGWNPGNGRLNHVALHPTDTSRIFVCAAGGGLWRTSDWGTSWECVTDAHEIDATSVVVFDSGNEDILYLGTGDRHGDDGLSKGLYVSEDGGDTWSLTALDANQTSALIYDLLVHPTESGHIYVATSNGVFESTDYGDSFEQIQTLVVRDMEFNTSDPSTMYFISGRRFYRSFDGGATITETTSGLPTYSNIGRTHIAVAETNSNYIYYLYSKENLYGGLYRSTNGGESFERMSEDSDVGNILGYEPDGSSENGQAWYDMALDVSDSDENEIHIGGILTFVSYDGGVTWDNTSRWKWPTDEGYNHADIHFVEYMGDRLYACTDGGLFVSYDNDYWFDLSEGLGISQYYRIDVAQTEDLRIAAGAQDNGTNIYNNGEWIHWLGADGMDCAIDHSNTDIIHGSVQLGGFYKTYTGGTTQDSTENIDGPWVTPLTMDPLDAQTLYVGSRGRMWKSTNGMDTLIELEGYVGSNSLEVKEIAVATSDTDVIYACAGSRIYKSPNGGNFWFEITRDLPNYAINYIAVNPSDEDELFICMGGYGSGQKVFRSTNGGSSWSNLSLNLPNVSCNTILYREGGSDILYLGTERSLYYYDRNDETWYEYGNGLPYANIMEMKIHEPSETIYVATYGRGIWSSPLTLIEKKGNDITLVSAEVPVYNCGPNFHPVLKVVNRGLNTISSMKIDYTVDNNTVTTSWQGELVQNQEMDIELDFVTLEQGDYTANFDITEVNGFTDPDRTNNIASASFTQSNLDESWFEIIIQPDALPSQTSYQLRSGSTRVDEVTDITDLGEDGMFRKRYYTSEFAEGCYKIRIMDSASDGICCDYGQGFLRVVNNCGDDLLVNKDTDGNATDFYVYDGVFGSSDIIEFCQEEFVGQEDLEARNTKVYPNPSSNKIFIDADFTVIEFSVFNAFGQLVLEKEIESVLSQYPVDISQWDSGLYFVHLQGEGISIQKKFLVVNEN